MDDNRELRLDKSFSLEKKKRFTLGEKNIVVLQLHSLRKIQYHKGCNIHPDWIERNND